MTALRLFALGGLLVIGALVACQIVAAVERVEARVVSGIEVGL